MVYISKLSLIRKTFFLSSFLYFTSSFSGHPSKYQSSNIRNCIKKKKKKIPNKNNKSNNITIKIEQLLCSDDIFIDPFKFNRIKTMLSLLNYLLTEEVVLNKLPPEIYFFFLLYIYILYTFTIYYVLYCVLPIIKLFQIFSVFLKW